MNCKPNDLAFIVRDTSGTTCVSKMIGTPVTVDAPFKTFVGSQDAWTLKSGMIKCPACGALLIGLLDADLQPIRGQRPGSTVGKRIEKPEEVTA